MTTLTGKFIYADASPVTGGILSLCGSVSYTIILDKTGSIPDDIEVAADSYIAKVVSVSEDVVWGPETITVSGPFDFAGFVPAFVTYLRVLCSQK